MFSRTDSAAWVNGLAQLRNAICTSLGPVNRRFGSDYIIGSDGAVAARCIGFKVDAVTSYFIGITDQDITIINVSDLTAITVEQVIASAPYSAAELATLQHDEPPEGEKIYIVCPTKEIRELVYDGTLALGSRWSFAILNLTGEPADWTGDNEPSVLTFFEGRFWLGATRDKPQTFWGSRSGDYTDFTIGSNPADGLEFTMAKRGKIEWMAATKNLLVGTSNGEHIVTSENGVIIPNDIQVVQQSSYGSRSAQALLIGNTTTYISPDGRKLRDVGFQFTENSWLSRDITFLSEHVTVKGNKIVEMIWNQHPNNLIWGVTELGNLVACTYERHYDVIGWHQHDTQGDYLSAASVEVDGTSIMLYATIRNDGEVSFEVQDDIDFMDSNVVVVPDVDLNFTVPHLANYLVQVTTGGAVHPDVQLDSNGNGQLDYTTDPSRPDDVVVVGLGYPTEIETLPLDYTPEEPGTSAHFMKRWNKIYVRVFDSAIPFVGKKTLNERPPTRTADTPMGEAQPVVTQDVKVLGLGWDRFSQVYIKQDLPVPLIVTGIFGELSQNVDED